MVKIISGNALGLQDRSQVNVDPSAINVLSIAGSDVYWIHSHDWKPDIDVYVTLDESAQYVPQSAGSSGGAFIEVNFGNGNQEAYLNTDKTSANQLVFTYTVGSSGLADRTDSTVQVVANSFSLNGHKLLNSAGQELSDADVPIGQTVLQNDWMAENGLGVLDWTFWLEGGSNSSIALNLTKDVIWTGVTTWDFFNTGRPYIRAGGKTYYFEPDKSSGNRVVFTSPNGQGDSSGTISVTGSNIGSGFEANGFPISFDGWSTSYVRYSSNFNEDDVAIGAAYITNTTVSEVTRNGNKAIRVDLEYDQSVDLSYILQEAYRTANYDIAVDLKFEAPFFTTKQAILDASESTATRKSFFYTIEEGVAGRMYLGNKINFVSGETIFYTSRPAISRTGFAEYSSLEIDRRAPYLSSVSLIDPANTTYAKGDTVRVAVAFSEPILFGQGVGDEMSIELQIGSRRVRAKAAQPYNNNAILFEYGVEEGLRDTDGIAVVQDSFHSTASSIIVDNAGNQADPLALKAALPAQPFGQTRVESIEIFRFDAARAASYAGALFPFILVTGATIESTTFSYVDGSATRTASGFSLVGNEVRFSGVGSDIQQAHNQGEQLSITMNWRDSANQLQSTTRILTLEPDSAPTWSAAQPAYTVARNRLLQAGGRLAYVGPVTETDGTPLSFAVFEGTSQTESTHFRVNEAGLIEIAKPYANTIRSSVTNGGGINGTVITYTQYLLNDGPIALRIEARTGWLPSTSSVTLNLDGQLTRNTFSYREDEEQAVYPSYVIAENGVLYGQKIIGQNLIATHRIGHTGITGVIDMVADFDSNNEFTGKYWVLTANDLYYVDIYTGVVLKESPLDHFQVVQFEESDEGDLILMDANGRQYEPLGVAGFQTDPDPARPVFYFDRDRSVIGEVGRNYFGAFMANQAQYGQVESVEFKFKNADDSLIDVAGFSLIDGGIKFSDSRSVLESGRVFGEELQVMVTHRAPDATSSDPVSTDVETFQLRHEEAPSIASLPQALVKAKSGLVSSTNSLSVYKQQLLSVGSKLAFIGQGHDPDSADAVVVKIFEGSSDTESEHFGIDSDGYLKVLKAYHPGASTSVSLTIQVIDKKAADTNAKAKITDRQTLALILPSSTTAQSGKDGGKSLSTNGYSPRALFPENPIGMVAQQCEQLVTDMQGAYGGYVGAYFRQEPGDLAELSHYQNWHESDDYGVLKTQARALADQVYAHYSGYSELGQQQVLSLFKSHGGLAFSATIQDVDKHDDLYTFSRDAYGHNNDKESLKDYLYQAADSYADALTRYIRDDQDEGDVNITDAWMHVRHTKIELVNTTSEYPPEILAVMALHAPEFYGDNNYRSLLKTFRTITRELGKAGGEYWRSPTLVAAGRSIAEHRRHGSGVQVDFDQLVATAQNSAILTVIDNELLPFYYQLAALSIETQQELNFLQRPHPLDYASRLLGDFLGIAPEDDLKLATNKLVQWTHTEMKRRGNLSATGAFDQNYKVYTHYNNSWVELLEDETQRKRLMDIWGERDRNAIVNRLKHSVRIVDQAKFDQNVQKLFAGTGGILDNNVLGSDLEDIKSSFQTHYSQRTTEITNAYKEQESQKIMLRAGGRTHLASVGSGGSYYDVLTAADKARVNTALLIVGQRLAAHTDSYQLHNLQHLREKQLDIAKAVFSHIPIIGSFVNIGIDAARGDFSSLGHDILESVATLVSFIPVVGPVLGAVMGAADLGWAVSDEVNSYLKAKRLGNDQAASEALAGIATSVASGVFMIGGAVNGASQQHAATPEIFSDLSEGIAFHDTEQVNIKGSSTLETAYRSSEGDLYSVVHDATATEAPTVSRLIAVDATSGGEQIFVKVPLGKLPDKLTFGGTIADANSRYHLEFSDQWNAADPETGQPTRVFKATRTPIDESGEPLRGVEEDSYYMRRANGNWTRVTFDGETFSYIDDTPDLPSVPEEEPSVPEPSTPVDENGFPNIPAFDPETLELEARLERLREGPDRIAELRSQLEGSRGLANNLDYTALGESRSAALAKLAAMEAKVDEFELDLSDVNHDLSPQPGTPEYDTYWESALDKLDEISLAIDDIGDQELEQRLAELKSWRTNLADTNTMPGLTPAEREAYLSDLDTLIDDTEETQTGLSDKMAGEVEVLERRLRQLQGLDPDTTVLGTGNVDAAPTPPTENPSAPTQPSGGEPPANPDGTLKQVRTKELPVLDEIAPELRQLTESLQNFAEEIASIDAEQAPAEKIGLTDAELKAVYERVFERAVKAVNEEVPSETPTTEELDTGLSANAAALSKEAVKVTDAATLASEEAMSALSTGQAKFYYPENGATGVAGDREVSVLVPVKLEGATVAELYRYEIARGLTDDEYQQAITSDIAKAVKAKQAARAYVTDSGRELDLVYVPSIKSAILVELTASLTVEQRELNSLSVQSRVEVVDSLRRAQVNTLNQIDEILSLSQVDSFTFDLAAAKTALEAISDQSNVATSQFIGYSDGAADSFSHDMTTSNPVAKFHIYHGALINGFGYETLGGTVHNFGNLGSNHTEISTDNLETINVRHGAYYWDGNYILGLEFHYADGNVITVGDLGENWYSLPEAQTETIQWDGHSLKKLNVYLGGSEYIMGFGMEFTSREIHTLEDRLGTGVDTFRNQLSNLETETTTTKADLENRLAIVKRLNDDLTRLRDTSQSNLALKDYLRLVDSLSAERSYLESEIALLTERGSTLNATSQAFAVAASTPLSSTATVAQARAWIATFEQAWEAADTALKSEVRQRLAYLLPSDADIPLPGDAKEGDDLAATIRNLVAEEPDDPALAGVSERLVALDQPLRDVIARLENQLSPDVAGTPTAAELAERLKENGRYIPEMGERLASSDPISTLAEGTLAKTTGVPHFHTDDAGTKWIIVPVEGTAAGTTDLFKLEVENGVDYETWTQAWRDAGGVLSTRAEPVAVQLTTFGDTYLVVNLPERGVVLTKPANALLTEIETRSQSFDPSNPAEVQFSLDGKNYRLGMTVSDRGGISWTAQDNVAGPIVLRQKAVATGQILDLFEMVDARTGEVYRSAEGEPITIVRWSSGAYTTTALHNEGLARDVTMPTMPTMPMIAVSAEGEEISLFFYQRNAFGTELWAEADAAGTIQSNGRIFAREFGVQFRDITETGDDRPMTQVADPRVLSDRRMTLAGSDSLEGRNRTEREFSPDAPLTSFVVSHGALINGFTIANADGTTESFGGTAGEILTTVSLDNLSSVKIHSGEYSWYSTDFPWENKHVVGMEFTYNDGSVVNLGDINLTYSSNVVVEDIDWKGGVVQKVTAYSNKTDGEYLGGISFDLASVDYEESFAANAAWSDVEMAIRDRAAPEHHVSWVSPTGEIYSSATQAPGATRLLVKLAHSTEVVVLRQVSDGTWQEIVPVTGQVDGQAAGVNLAWGGYFFRTVTRTKQTFPAGGAWDQVEAAVMAGQNDIEWTAPDGITYSSSDSASDPRHRLVTVTQDDGTQKAYAAENISGWSWSAIDVATGDTVPGNFLVNSYDSVFEFYFDQEVANSSRLIGEIAEHHLQELDVPAGGWIGKHLFGNDADWTSVIQAYTNAQTARKFVEWTTPSGKTYSSRVFADPTNPDLLTVLPDSSEIVALSRMSGESWAIIDRTTGEADLSQVVTRQADGTFSAPVDVLAQQRAFQENFLGDFAVQTQGLLPVNEQFLAAVQEAKALYISNNSGGAGAPTPEEFQFEGQSLLIAELTDVSGITGPQILSAVAADGSVSTVYELIDSETGNLFTRIYLEQLAGSAEAESYGERFVYIVENQNGQFRSTSALNQTAIATQQDQISIYTISGEKIDVNRDVQTRTGWYAIDAESGYRRTFQSSVLGGLFQETTGAGLLGGVQPGDVIIEMEPLPAGTTFTVWTDIQQRFNDGTSAFLAWEAPGGVEYYRYFDLGAMQSNAIVQLNLADFGITLGTGETATFALKNSNNYFTMDSTGRITRTAIAIPADEAQQYTVKITISGGAAGTREEFRTIGLPTYETANFRLASVDSQVTALQRISGKYWQQIDTATGNMKSTTATDVIVESTTPGAAPSYSRLANHIDTTWQLATGAVQKPFNGVQSFGYTGDFSEMGEYNPEFRFARSASADEAGQNVEGLLHIREEIEQLGGVTVTPFTNKLSVAVLELNGVNYVRGYGQRLISLEDLTYTIDMLGGAVTVGGQTGILKDMFTSRYSNEALSPGQSSLMLLSEAASYYIDDAGAVHQVDGQNTPDIATVKSELAGNVWANYSIGSIYVPGIEKGEKEGYLLNNKGGVYVDYNKFENRLILFQGAWRSVTGTAPAGGESSHFLSGPIISELKGVSSVEALYHPSVPGARLPAYANYFNEKTDVTVSIPKDNPAILRVTLQDGTQHLISIADKSVKMGFGTSLHNADRSGAPFASQAGFTDIDTYSYDGSFISRNSSFNTGPTSKFITTTRQYVDVAPLVVASEGATTGTGRWLWDGLANLGRNRLFSPSYTIGRMGNIASKTLLTIALIGGSSRVAELIATAFSEGAVGQPAEGPFANATNSTNLTDWVETLISQATDTVLPTLYENVTSLFSNDTLNATLADSFNITDNTTSAASTISTGAPAFTIDDATTALSTWLSSITQSTGLDTTSAAGGPEGLANPELWGMIASMVAAQETITVGSDFVSGFFNLENYLSHHAARLAGGTIEEMSRLLVNYGIQYGASGVFKRSTPSEEMLGITLAAVILSGMRAVRNRIPGSAARFDGSTVMATVLRGAELLTDYVWRGNLLTITNPSKFTDTGIGIVVRAISREDKASLPIAQYLIDTLKNDNIEALRAQLSTRKNQTLLGSERLAAAGNRFVGAVGSVRTGTYNFAGNRILGPIGRSMTEAWPEILTQKGLIESFGRWRKSWPIPSERETAYAAQIEGSVQRDLDILDKIAAGDADLDQIYDRLKDGTYTPTGANADADPALYDLSFSWARNVGSGMRELYLSAGKAASETHLAIQSSLNFRKYTAAKFQGEISGSVPFGETTFSTQYQREIAEVHKRIKGLATLKADLKDNPKAAEITNAIVKYTVESGLFHYKLRYDDTGSQFVEDLGDGDVALHNTVLANGKLLTPRANERVDGLDAILANYGFGIAQKFNSITYRGVNSQSSIIPDEPSNSLVLSGVTGRSFSSGDVLTNTEIFSTSQAGPLASNFANSIDQFQTQGESRLTLVLRGKTSVNVSQITDQNQAETIYSPGALFEVEKIAGDESGNDIGRVVYLRQIDTSEWEVNNYYYEKYINRINDDGVTFENTIGRAITISGDVNSFIIVEPYTGKTYKITNTGDATNPQLSKQYAPFVNYFTGRVLDPIDNPKEVARWRRPFDGDSTTSGLRDDIYYHFAKNDDQHIVATQIGDLTQNIHMSFFRKARAAEVAKAVATSVTDLLDSGMVDAQFQSGTEADLTAFQDDVTELAARVSTRNMISWDHQFAIVAQARTTLELRVTTLQGLINLAGSEMERNMLETAKGAIEDSLDYAGIEVARLTGERRMQASASAAETALNAVLQSQTITNQSTELLTWQIANHLRRKVTIHNLVPSTTEVGQYQTGDVAFEVSEGFDGTNLTSAIGINIGQVRHSTGAVTYYIRNGYNGGRWTLVDVPAQDASDEFPGLATRGRDLLYAVALELHPNDYFDISNQIHPQPELVASFKNIKAGVERLLTWDYDRYRVGLSDQYDAIQADPSFSGVEFHAGGRLTPTASLNKSYAVKEFTDINAAIADGFMSVPLVTQTTQLGGRLYQKTGDTTFYYESTLANTTGGTPSTRVRLIPVKLVEFPPVNLDGQNPTFVFKNLEKSGRALDYSTFKGDRYVVATMSVNDRNQTRVDWTTSRFRPIDLASVEILYGDRIGLAGRIFRDKFKNLFVRSFANINVYTPVRAVSVSPPWLIQGEPSADTLAFQNLEHPEKYFFWTGSDAVMNPIVRLGQQVDLAALRFFEAFVPLRRGGNFTVLRSQGHATLRDALNDPEAGHNAFLFRTDRQGNGGTWNAIAEGENGHEVIRELFGDNLHLDNPDAAPNSDNLAYVTNGKAYVRALVDENGVERSDYLAATIESDPIGAAPVLSDGGRILMREGLVSVNGQKLLLYRDFASNMRKLFLPSSKGLATVTEVSGNDATNWTLTANVNDEAGNVHVIEVVGRAVGASATVMGSTVLRVTLVSTDQAGLNVALITPMANPIDVAGTNKLLSSYALVTAGIPMVFHNQTSGYLWTYSAEQGVTKGLVPAGQADVNGRYPLTVYSVTDNQVAYYERDAAGTGSWKFSGLHRRENRAPYVSFGTLNMDATVTQNPTDGSLASVSFSYRGEGVSAIGSDGTLARGSTANTEVLRTDYGRRYSEMLRQGFEVANFDTTSAVNEALDGQPSEIDKLAVALYRLTRVESYAGYDVSAKDDGNATWYTDHIVSLKAIQAALRAKGLMKTSQLAKPGAFKQFLATVTTVDAPTIYSAPAIVEHFQNGRESIALLSGPNAVQLSVSDDGSVGVFRTTTNNYLIPEPEFTTAPIVTTLVDPNTKSYQFSAAALLADFPVGSTGVSQVTTSSGNLSVLANGTYDLELGAAFSGAVTIWFTTVVNNITYSVLRTLFVGE